MADIELVIKLNEEYIKQIDKIRFLIGGIEDRSLQVNVINAIKNGTPLPKGHRFIDADEILNHAFIRDDEEGDIFVQKYYCIKKEIMDNALVLFDTLEADKEQEDGKV